MSITRAEAARLLTLASSWDNRNVGEAAAAAYVESGHIARWSFMEACEAIKDYYTNTTDVKPWVMPSHITAYIKRTREDRALRETGRELTSAAADPRVLAAATQMARRLEIPAQFRPSENRALRVKCPHCEAGVNQACTRKSHGGPRECSPHPSRVELAEVNS